ncbi:hypothetical protein HPP92_026338 [Vanilla planifolia]|uniref:Uncharacterized protein n=1 Tax=Vanilla planifolia TaxID=51239 RepID=A0A835PCL5_VANPL|nr:hypothetical protein HPP92_026338 [Vanilla planifolia]
MEYDLQSNRKMASASAKPMAKRTFFNLKAIEGSGFGGKGGMWRSGKTGLPEVLRVSDSSPDTAETSFRELDDVFLQTQTRIWLGQVLHVRFDDEVTIADLLADGEMLFQVSKKLWKMLLKKHGELKHSKVYIYERTSSGRIDGRYMPYPKVDSFLKICQILGLTGIDMFSPSDVVEKRDTRRVCMCIRSLSKKARSKQLNVPDFDIVTYAIAMPTNLVDGIRKYLELSHFCSSKFNGSSPWNDTSETCRQKARSGKHYQYYDSGSDEADSIFNDLLSNGSSDVANISCTVRETSHGIASLVEENVPGSGFMDHFEDNNHYEEDVGGRQEETLIQTDQFFSSSSHSEIPTYHDTRICLTDVGEGCGLLSKSNRHSQQFDADNVFLKKDVGNRLKAELNVDSIEVETSSPASTIIASSVEVAPCKKNCLSPDSVLVSFLDHMVPNKVDSKNSTREHPLERKDDSMENRFDDTGIFVKPKVHGISNGFDGDDDNLSQTELLSANNLNSLDPLVSDFKLEESYYSMVSSEVEPLLTLFADKKNPSSKQSQDAMDCAGSFAKNRLILPSKCDDLRYPSCSESIAFLVPSSFTQNRFECCQFSSICPLCNDQKIKCRLSKIRSENFVCQVKSGSKEKSINAELPLGWDDEKEERKVYKYSTVSNFRNKLLSRNLNESEGESKKHELSPKDRSCQQTKIEKDKSVEVKESLCKETCFSVPSSIEDGTVSKYISGPIEVYSAASVNSENIDRSIRDRASSVNDFSLVRSIYIILLQLLHTTYY